MVVSATWTAFDETLMWLDAWVWLAFTTFDTLDATADFVAFDATTFFDETQSTAGLLAATGAAVICDEIADAAAPLCIPAPARIDDTLAPI